MRDIFLGKSYTKWGKETSLRPFSKNDLWVISLKFDAVCFYYMAS